MRRRTMKASHAIFIFLTSVILFSKVQAETLLETSQIDLENNGQMLIDINNPNSNFELVDKNVSNIEVE